MDVRQIRKGESGEVQSNQSLRTRMWRTVKKKAMDGAKPSVLLPEKSWNFDREALEAIPAPALFLDSSQANRR
jgi:hypothetical protein